MNNDHNPPAFARPCGKHDDGQNSSQEGMTLRDYFAGQALAAMITANENGPGAFRYNDGSNDNPMIHKFCSMAYTLADMMLQVRKPKPGTDDTDDQ